MSNPMELEVESDFDNWSITLRDFGGQWVFVMFDGNGEELGHVSINDDEKKAGIQRFVRVAGPDSFDHRLKCIEDNWRDVHRRLAVLEGWSRL